MNIPENFDRWMFDYVEGNLSPSEVETFERFLTQNSNFEAEADAWNNAFIQDENLTYFNQKALQREKKFAGWYGWSTAAIFAILLGAGGYFIIDSTRSKTNNNLKALSQISENNGLRNILSRKKDYNPIPLTSTIENDITLLSSSNNNQSQSNQNTQYGQNTVTANNSILAVNNDEASLFDQNDNTENVTSINQPDYNNASSESISEENNLITYTEEEDFSDNTSLKQEHDKFDSDGRTSKYQDNPEENDADLDLQKKSNLNYNSVGSKVKRVYHKIEKMMGYPVGLVNLRDPELIIPENDLLSFNPGFTGGTLKPRFEANYRNQWQGTELNTNIASISFDNYVSQIKGGVGVKLNSSIYGNGAFADNSIDLLYSPKIGLGKNIVLEPAIKVTLGLLTSNTAKFNGGANFEMERGLMLETANITSEQTDKLFYKDYGVGFVLNTKWFYAGFSADNLSSHYANIYANDNAEPVRAPTKIAGVIGSDYESANKNMTISPFISYRRFGENEEFWGGLNYRLNKFTIGGAYSNNQDYTLAIGMKFKKFKMLYHYDKTATTFTNQSLASHNIGIRITGEAKNKRFKY